MSHTFLVGVHFLDERDMLIKLELAEEDINDPNIQRAVIYSFYHSSLAVRTAAAHLVVAAELYLKPIPDSRFVRRSLPFSARLPTSIGKATPL